MLLFLTVQLSTYYIMMAFSFLPKNRGTGPSLRGSGINQR